MFRQIKATLVAIIIMLLPLYQIQTAQAAAVVCSNCGTEWTQLVTKYKMIEQVNLSAEQLRVQIKNYEDRVKQGRQLSQQVWGQARRDIAQLNALMARSRQLVSEVAQLEQTFKEQYKGYSEYVSQGRRIDWNTQAQQWDTQTRQTIVDSLQGSALHASQLQSDVATMERIDELANSAQGRMQALQAANMIASQQVKQMQKLRQLMILNMQTQANFMAQQQQQRAASQAAWSQFNRPLTNTHNNGRRW